MQGKLSSQVMGNTHASKDMEITTTVWNLPFSDSVQAVLRHGEVSGLREISLGGKLMLTETKKMDNGSKHQIQFQDKVLHFAIKCSAFSFKYSLTIDGKEVPCHLDQVSKVQEEYDFSVTDARVVDDSTLPSSPGGGVGAKVVFYKVVVTKKGTTDTEVCTIEHRYSDFLSLYNQMKSMYKKSPNLRKVLPQPPGKDAKILTNHTEAGFVQKRKEGLNEFMTKLASFPGVLQVPGIDDWLGLNSL